MRAGGEGLLATSVLSEEAKKRQEKREGEKN